MNKPKLFVLVVEDDLNSQLLMKHYIMDNYDYDFSVSVAEAKKQIKNRHVDIILLDIALQGSEDGLDLARYIRQEGKWPHIKIIATTAHAFSKDRDNCMSAGCDNYISKPIKKTELLEMVGKLK